MTSGYFETWRPPGLVGAPTVSPAPFDAIYCISLQEQQQRFLQACDHFQQIGLDHEVLFHRPRRAKQPFKGCWQSHAAVAHDALRHGFQNVLILEDDVQFLKPWAEIRQRVSAGMADLPRDWRGFYVGHRPRKAYFFKANLLRSMSFCTHAYVANRPLLEWLAETEPYEATVPYRVAALDGAFEVMQGMYALFPMLATQRYTGQSFHQSPWVERMSMYRLMEAAAAVLSPWHRLTFPDERADEPYILDTPDARQARKVLESGVFDREFYRRNNPDVAAALTSPLLHYVRHGRHEGRAPNGRSREPIPTEHL